MAYIIYLVLYHLFLQLKRVLPKLKLVVALGFLQSFHSDFVNFEVGPRILVLRWVALGYMYHSEKKMMMKI